VKREWDLRVNGQKSEKGEEKGHWTDGSETKGEEERNLSGAIDNRDHEEKDNMGKASKKGTRSFYEHCVARKQKIRKPRMRVIRNTFRKRGASGTEKEAGCYN